MKKRIILALSLLIGTGCRPDQLLQAHKDQSGRELPTPAASATVNESVKVPKESAKNVPAEFTGIDFENQFYPVSALGKTIHLRNGEYELASKDIGGRLVSFQGVNYSDLTGDGKKEAIVELDLVSCGGSCDGGSSLFYFYSLQQGKPVLLSRLETGSLGYDCGLKSFVLENRMLTLETFRACSFRGRRAIIPSANDREERGGKFLTNRFTRFILEFKAGNLVLRKREVFPYPEDDFRGYEPKIEINDD